MLTLAHPWLLVLLPVPLLVWFFVPAYREIRQGLVVPFLARFAGSRSSSGRMIANRSRWRWVCVWLCWTCVVTAIARPEVIEPPIRKEIPVRDMLLAVDLSGSMDTKDLKDASGKTVDRLTVVKEVLRDFLTKRKGDRVGLIFFGSAPFVQAPFTEDLEVCEELLDEAQVKMAGPQTAFGDALGLAINQFDRSKVKDRVLIALTDGNDTASQVPPQKASQIAKDKGIVIHTVAVGDPKAAGEDALDEQTLKNVATTTGGIYAYAADREQLTEIYDKLDKLETRKVQTVSHLPRRNVYWWPLVVALSLSMLQLTLLVVRDWLWSRSAIADPPLVAVSLAQVAICPLGLFAVSGPTLHFIRPLWLLMLIPALMLWWLLRQRGESNRRWRDVVAPHLLTHLLSGPERRSCIGPRDLAAVLWLVTIVAIAGPTRRHQPAPFANDTAALAIVVKVSPSMKTEDVQPSRLIRATQKIHDLLQTRGPAKTSLIAYSGSAHVVMPATTDGELISSFAESLDPEIMPIDGDAAADAFKLADRTLRDAGGGSILWIADNIASEQTAALSQWRRDSTTDLRLYPPLMAGDELEAAENAVQPLRAGIVRLTADDSDVRKLASEAKYANLRGDDSDLRWAESGYWLSPLLACVMLPFFRKGWMVSTGI